MVLRGSGAARFEEQAFGPCGKSFEHGAPYASPLGDLPLLKRSVLFALRAPQVRRRRTLLYFFGSEPVVQIRR
jgi:hypothetical protein